MDRAGARPLSASSGQPGALLPEGIQALDVDAIGRRPAWPSARSLYGHFSFKDYLVQAYLSGGQNVAPVAGGARGSILDRRAGSWRSSLGEWFESEPVRGCALVNVAGATSAGEGSAGRLASTSGWCIAPSSACSCRRGWVIVRRLRLADAADLGCNSQHLRRAITVRRSRRGR